MLDDLGMGLPDWRLVRMFGLLLDINCDGCITGDEWQMAAELASGLPFAHFLCPTESEDN